MQKPNKATAPNVAIDNVAIQSGLSEAGGRRWRSVGEVERYQRLINDRIRAELATELMKRDWSYSDLARKAKMSISLVCRILSPGVTSSATVSPKFADIIILYETMGLPLPFGQSTL